MNQWKKVKRVLCNKKGFGVQEVLGIAAVFIIAGFILIPGLQDLATSMVDALKSWFETTIKTVIFPTVKP